MLVTRTEALYPQVERLLDGDALALTHIGHPLASCRHHQIMVLAGVRVEQLEVVHGEHHRTLRLIDGAPCLVINVIDALQVIAHAEAAYSHRCIVGEEEHLLSVGKELDGVAYDGRIGKSPVMALAAYTHDAQAVLLLL